MSDDTITIIIEKCGETTVTLNRAEYEAAKAAGQLALLLDPEVSDIDCQVTITEPVDHGYRYFSLR